MEEFPNFAVQILKKSSRIFSLLHKCLQRWNSWTSICQMTFAPCYSQSLLLADFKENHTVLLVLKNPYKKSVKQENASLFMNSIL
jgi:hypothetical protein